ncbi:MAG: HEPN domain-containing protein [Planctomycetes bacterium]|nr:HEPN domain-containing protein [Planctomycetota bacterium]
MIGYMDLQGLAEARLEDAQALLQASRYDGAVYLGGYAIEIALKARIARTLAWAGFPAKRNEFQDYQSFRTHDLEVLLHLSGVEEAL